MNKTQRNPSLWVEIGAPVVVLAYFAVVLFVSGCLILRAWPDNCWSKAVIEANRSLRAATEVTRTRLTQLHVARELLAQWQTDKTTEMTATNRLTLDDALRYATALQPQAATNLLPLSRPELVTPEALEGAQQQLIAAIKALGERQLQVRSNLTERPVALGRLARINAVARLHAWLFAPPPDPLAGVFFTADEEIEMLQLAGDSGGAEAASRNPTPSAFLGSAEMSHFVLLAAFGSLGAIIQGISSVAMFLGNRRFLARWTVFYFGRPFVGAGIAAAFYLALRAGMAPDLSLDATNNYVVCALAMLIGLFSGEAMEKLKEIAGVFFKPNKSSDELHGRLPHISQVNVQRKPAAAPAPATESVLEFELLGQNLRSDSLVLIDRVLIAAKDVESNQEESEVKLTATVRDLEGSRATVAVLNPGTDGGLSAFFAVKLPAKTKTLA